MSRNSDRDSLLAVVARAIAAAGWIWNNAPVGEAVSQDDLPTFQARAALHAVADRLVGGIAAEADAEAVADV